MVTMNIKRIIKIWVLVSVRTQSEYWNFVKTKKN